MCIGNENITGTMWNYGVSTIFIKFVIIVYYDVSLNGDKKTQSSFDIIVLIIQYNFNSNWE